MSVGQPSDLRHLTSVIRDLTSDLSEGRWRQAQRGSPAPLGVRVLFSELAVGALGLSGFSLGGQNFAEKVERFRNHEGAWLLFKDDIDPWEGGSVVLPREVIGGDPELFLSQTLPAEVDLRERIGRVPAARIFLHQLPERFERFRRVGLVLFNRLHLVVIAERQSVLGEISDPIAGIE